jgi:hypothetical protein
MEYKSNEYLKKLSEVGKEILDTILSLLKERNIKSINLYAYWSERDVDRYTFYDVDSDGYGVALYIDKLYVTEVPEDGIELKMLNTDDESWDEWDEENLSTNDRLYLLDMIEQILEVADDEDNGRVLGADEEFDDWDD